MESDFEDLKAGEKVYFHYLSLDPKPQLPPDCWIIHYKMLYCVIRDGIVMLNDYVFVEIIDAPKPSKIIITEDKKSTTKGIVRYSASDQLVDGDVVLFSELGAFVNEIEGKEYYVMEVQDVLAKVL